MTPLQDKIENSRSQINYAKHAEQIIKKLLARPETKDNDGFYNLYLDEQQMIDIVKKYLDEHFY